MSQTFDLDSIREAAEKKYGNVTITFGDDSVRFLNPMRMSKERRAKLVALQDQLDAAFKDEDGDQGALLADGIRIIADDDKAADRLLAQVGNDLTILASLFEKYTEGTQAGEA